MQKKERKWFTRLKGSVNDTPILYPRFGYSRTISPALIYEWDHHNGLHWIFPWTGATADVDLDNDAEGKHFIQVLFEKAVPW